MQKHGWLIRFPAFLFGETSCKEFVLTHSWPIKSPWLAQCQHICSYRFLPCVSVQEFFGAWFRLAVTPGNGSQIYAFFKRNEIVGNQTKTGIGSSLFNQNYMNFLGAIFSYTFAVVGSSSSRTMSVRLTKNNLCVFMVMKKHPPFSPLLLHSSVDQMCKA